MRAVTRTSLVFTICLATVQLALATETGEVLRRWDETCRQISSYDIRVTIDSELNLNGDVEAAVTRRPTEKIRFLYSQGLRRIEMAPDQPGDPHSVTIWDGKLRQSFPVGAADRARLTNRFHQPASIDFELLYRDIYQTESWTDLLRGRPNLTISRDQDRYLFYSPAGIGRYNYSPIGFRVWIDPARNHLPVKIQWLLKQEQVEFVTSQIEITHRQIAGVWFPVKSIKSHYGFEPPAGEPEPAQVTTLVVDANSIKLNQPLPRELFEFQPTTELSRRLTQLFPADPESRLAQLLVDARAADRHVLLWIADANSDEARQLAVAIDDNDINNQKFLDAVGNFRVLGVDPSRTELLGDVGIEADVDDTLLVILDAEGNLLQSIPFDQVAIDRRLSRYWLTAVLESQKPHLDNARDVFAGAIAAAKQGDKRVLVHVGGPRCAPCIALSRALDACDEVLSKAYVVTSLDGRQPHAEEVVRRLRKNRGGIPWMVILDADGNNLVTSDGPKGNIGYPSSEYGKAHFEQMIRDTTDRLSDDEIAEVLMSFGS